MTEFELIEATNQYISQMQTGEAVFISQISAYLIVAYLAGATLTRFQVTLVNLLLIVAVLVSFAALEDNMQKLLHYDALAEELVGGPFATGGEWVISVYLWYRVVIGAGCLIFMWQSRHRKTG